MTGSQRRVIGTCCRPFHSLLECLTVRLTGRFTCGGGTSLTSSSSAGSGLKGTTGATSWGVALNNNSLFRVFRMLWCKDWYLQEKEYFYYYDFNLSSAIETFTLRVAPNEETGQEITSKKIMSVDLVKSFTVIFCVKVPELCYKNLILKLKKTILYRNRKQSNHHEFSCIWMSFNAGLNLKLKYVLYYCISSFHSFVKYIFYICLFYAYNGTRI